jgi:predicted HTH transcriptional regulator
VEYELPESAVAEAIANAVAHRDYTSNGSVQVMLFRNRLEVWNPGRLPDGFTVQKLREMHSSEPTNPVIAHPLFLTGYIEHLGTGTTDMIADCEEYGLRTPEFIQAEDFRTIIWRKEKVLDPSPKVSDLNEKVSNPSPKVSDHGEKVTEQDAESNRVRLTAKQQKVLEFCNEMPRTAREIIEMIGVKYHTKTLEQYINKLVYSGFLRPTQGKSHDSNRKYITAHDGE